MSALHITNGDSAADTLRTFLTAPVAITADPLFEGPAPDVDDAEWYATRGWYLSGYKPGASEATARDLAAWDRALESAIARGDEVVLWFEHDLFDQLLLIRVLDRIARAAVVTPEGTAENIWLICIDRFPGVVPFYGLGQLTAAQLATLVDTRKPVTAAQLDEAGRAWTAFRGTDPTKLALRTGALPFLGAALRRLLEEYPSTDNGLSRSATQVLRALEGGPLEGGALFAASQALEEYPFMGDWGLFDVVRALAAARVALVTINPRREGVDLRGHTIALTDAGRDVLAGRADAVALNGINEWRGGVHLSGADRSPWRWDAARETLVSLGT